MQLEITKKVRMSKTEAKLLARLAKAGNTSESEVLRRALDEMAIQERRSRAIDGLIAMAKAEKQPYRKPFFRMSEGP